MKIPYSLTAATRITERNQHMLCALATGYPRLSPVLIDETRTLSIVAYGPSLEDTWQDIRHPILSMSGATRFLADRGITADFHCDMDPRPHKVKHLAPPIPGVHYLMASVCPPQTWELLKEERVTLFHVFSGRDDAGRDTYDFVAEHDPGAYVGHGGSTIGLTALHLGGVLGYRHFEIFGMDGSFRDDSRSARHAGPHYGTKQQDGRTWNAEGKTYQTSRIMANAVAETINSVSNYPMFCVFHGSGLTQALIREANVPNACTADQTEKARRIRSARARFVDMPKVDVSEGGRSYWDSLLAQPDSGQWLSDVLTIAREAEARRRMASYNTGTVPVETALLLRAMTAWYKPRVAVEIGTFIGTSTLALDASEVYTCDRDNDCLPSTERIHCYPHQTSTQLLQRLVDLGATVDFFFFDGRLQQGDCHLVMKLSHARTLYAFDDFTGLEKGVINLGKLATLLPNHAMIQPYAPFAGRSTLAALVPMVTP